MSRYGQFCAVARALEVLGERWALLVARELLLGSTTFTEIRCGLPHIPRATLSSRLRGLRMAGVVEMAGREYYLTEAGRALAPVMRELARWATITESAALSEGDLDTAALIWDMRRRIDSAALPERTVVLAIEFTDRATDRNFWLHLSRAEVNLCRQDTGDPVGVWLAAPTAEATRWWLGHSPGPSFSGTRMSPCTATGTCSARCTAGSCAMSSRRRPLTTHRVNCRLPSRTAGPVRLGSPTGRR
jgi:DNA-binding HxlR family transcriptional regulator